MRRGCKLVASVAAMSLFASTTAVADPLPQTSRVQAPNAWMMLSALGPARGVSLGGANAAAQPADLPPRPAAANAGAGVGVTGELLPVLLWFGLIAIALTSSGPHARSNSPP
jgi:hypothetical protein